MRKVRRVRNEKGSHCFFKSSGYDKLEHKHQNLFFQAYRMHYSTRRSVQHGTRALTALG